MKEMPKPDHRPGLIWQLMRRLNQFAVRNIRRGMGPASLTLILWTTGRKTGLPRQTPLQYELWNGAYYVGAARGRRADWLLNLQADPAVFVEVGGIRYTGTAQVITDPQALADFFELRLQRHPLMVGSLMRLEGLPLRYSRQDLERFASGKAAAVICISGAAEDAAG